MLRYRCTRSSEITAASASQNVTHRLDDVRPHDCWLLVADVEGFAALNGQLGSEAALRRLQAWITEARPLLEKNGACINGYVGDAIFAYWRCDVAQPAQVLAALRALEAWRPRSPLPFRMVAHRGNALFTKSDRGEELTGQDVNFVFRSEKIAKGFGASAMLSEAAVESLGLAGCCDSYGGSAIDGMGDFHVFHGLPRAWRDPAAPV